MGAHLSPVSGVKLDALRQAIAVLRVALRRHRVAADLRPVQLSVDFHRDIDQLGDRLDISPAAVIQFRALEAAQNDITPQAGRIGGGGESNRELRPWPFRWPSQDLPALAPYAMPEPLPEPGRYIDILF